MMCYPRMAIEIADRNCSASCGTVGCQHAAHAEQHMAPNLFPYNQLMDPPTKSILRSRLVPRRVTVRLPGWVPYGYLTIYAAVLDISDLESYRS